MYWITASYDVKDAVVFAYGTGFSVRKWVPTGRIKEELHQDVGDKNR